MRSTTFFHSTLNFLVGSFFLFVGLLSLAFPWLGSLRRAAVDAFVAHPLTMTVLGIGFLAVGATMLLALRGQQRQYYHIKTGDQSILVSEGVIEDYVNDYWERHFPQQEYGSQVVIHNDRLQITADLPPLSFDEQRPFLKKVERDLTTLLADRIGYLRGFSLSVSFQEADRALAEAPR